MRVLEEISSFFFVDLKIDQNLLLLLEDESEKAFQNLHFKNFVSPPFFV